MNLTIEKIYSKFHLLKAMVCKMNVNWHESEDFVQDFIIHLSKKDPIVINECWDDEEQKLRPFIWFCLRSYVVDEIRKRNAVKKVKPQYVGEFFDSHAGYEPHDMEREIKQELLLRKVVTALNAIDAYTSKVTRIKVGMGMSYREMSREMQISYISLWKTVKPAIEYVQEVLGEDYEDLKNQDYEWITFTREEKLLLEQGLQGGSEPSGQSGDEDRVAGDGTGEEENPEGQCLPADQEGMEQDQC